jgi:CheY-like chemotaxis protein
MMQFLIIDDSNVDAHALTSTLQSLGHKVDRCDAGNADAMSAIESGKYQAVFLDIVMPEQDGYKFLRSVRLNEATAQQYIAICSSKNTALEINYGIKRGGANDYLTKPVSRESVEAALAKIPATTSVK